MAKSWTRLIVAFGIAIGVPLAMIAWRISRQAARPVPPRAPASSIPEEVRALLVEFRSTDWATVHRAEERLVSQQNIAIPALIEMLDADIHAPLTNTADLIYPGAKEFFGHGYFVDYDLDYLPARAGWALEELTFCEFGFSEVSTLERRLPKSVRSGRVEVELAIVDPATLGPRRRRERLEPAIAAAKAWWAKHGANWTRFGAIREAITSSDVRRQSNTLEWIRYGTTRCDGLTPDSYAQELRPIVSSLAHSGNEGVRTQAELLLADREAHWRRFKSDPNWSPR